jgi:hypothetical protein
MARPWNRWCHAGRGSAAVGAAGVPNVRQSGIGWSIDVLRRREGRDGWLGGPFGGRRGGSAVVIEREAAGGQPGHFGRSHAVPED